MSTRRFLRAGLISIVLVPGTLALFGGCMMAGWGEHDCDMCDDDDDDDGTNVQLPPPDSGASCQTDAECVKGSYCDVAQSRCVESGSCTKEADCGDGFDCDASRATCVPALEPTCEELVTELECLERGACSAVYAGVNCSCGPDCSCKGGEPGCVCQSFEFFRCADASR